MWTFDVTWLGDNNKWPDFTGNMRPFPNYPLVVASLILVHPIPEVKMRRNTAKDLYTRVKFLCLWTLWFISRFCLLTYLIGGFRRTKEHKYLTYTMVTYFRLGRNPRPLAGYDMACPEGIGT